MARRKPSASLLGDFFPVIVKHHRLVLALFCSLLLESKEVSAIGDLGSVNSKEKPVSGDMQTDQPTEIATIEDARLISTQQIDYDKWRIVQNSTWEKLSLARCWNVNDGNSPDGHEPIFEDPGLFYSPNFGYVVAERITYQEKEFPNRRY